MAGSVLQDKTIARLMQEDVLKSLPNAEFVYPKVPRRVRLHGKH